MLTVRKLRRKPHHFFNFTGLRPDAFDELVSALKPIYRERDHQRKSRPNRKRAIGAGPRFALVLEDRLLMTLMYFRLYLSQPLLSYFFDVDNSTVCREIRHRMLPALLQVLPVPMREELGLVQDKADSVSRKRIGSLEELLIAHPEFEEIFIDATEQPTPRPKDPLKRYQRYSGKRKRHTLKTQVTTTDTAILHVSGSVAGRVNDLTLLRFSGVPHQVPKATTVRLDRGYESVEADYPDVRFEKPIRNQRGHRLTELGRAYNRMQNQVRVKVEHVLSRVKKFRMLAGCFRGWLDRYDDCFAVCCGLHNYRTMGVLTW